MPPPADAVPARPTAAVTSTAITEKAPARTWYHREVIGHSHDGRAITAYRAGEKGKPVVVVVATIHGDEGYGRYVARGLLQGRKIKG